MSESEAMFYVFGDYCLAPPRRELRYQGLPVSLEPKVYQVLLYLLQHRDRLVTKEALLDHIWSGVYVTDTTVARCLTLVRQAIGDSGTAQRLIKTVHGQGYRFVAPVTILTEAPAEVTAVVEAHASPVAPRQTRRCGACQQPNPVSAYFCSTCGIPLVGLCLHCGQAITLPATFCTQCGQRVEASVQASKASTDRPGGLLHSLSLSPLLTEERKVATVVSGLITSSVSLLPARDLDDQHAFVKHLEMLLQEAVHPYAGTLQHLRSDRFTVVFGAPLAQEDHVQRAVLAALSLQQRWPTFVQACSPTSCPASTLQLGVHTGQLVVHTPGELQEQAPSMVGDVLLFAEVLAQHAGPGTILVSAATAQGVSPDFSLEAVPPLRVPGQAIPLAVYRMLPDSPKASPPRSRRTRFRSRFSGRRAELAVLLTGLARARHSQGQVIGIVAEAGMGKTRLLEEFRQQIAAQEVTYLTGHCQSYGQIMPYLPLRELIQQHCALQDTDDATTCASKLRRSLRRLHVEIEECLPWLLHLLGFPNATDSVTALSPQARRVRTFEALHQFFLASGQQQPLVIEVENLQWIDATSEAYLAAWCERIVKAAVVLIVTYRPGYLPPWHMSSMTMRLPLLPLSTRDSQGIVRGILGRQRLTASAFQQIVARAHGNPFFLEELALATREQDTHTFHPQLPSTIHAVLASRIDRLPPDAKRLLQAAAVLGLELPISVLQTLVELPPDVFNDSLQHLQSAEFLYINRLVPEPIYTFKHTLTRETAYHSLLKHTRQHYHHQIVQTMMERFPDLATNQPELLAYHYAEAGLTRQAVDYWQQAGQHAIERGAHDEAIIHLSRALECLKTVPDVVADATQELDVQLLLGVALSATKGYAAPEVAQVYTRARELCQHVGTSPQLVSALTGLCTYYAARGLNRMGLDLAEQFFALAKQQQTPALHLIAHRLMGTGLFHLGQFVAARDHVQRGIEYEVPQQGGLPLVANYSVACHCYAAWASWFLGFPEQALVHSRHALALAQELSHAFSLALAQYFTAMLHQLRRESHVAQRFAEDAMRLAAERGFDFYLAGATIVRGWALTVQEQRDIGCAQMRQGLAAWQAMQAEVTLPTFLALLAEASEQPKAGLQTVTEALALVEAHEERYYEAELYRIQGELMYRQANTTAAEGHFLKALDIARAQQAKALELRAATSLSRLWWQQGKHAAARQLLTDIYTWFTEGFDTADLKDAKALLDTLA